MIADEENIRIKDLPIFRKGKEIMDVVIQITDLIPEDNEILVDIKGCIICDAALLTVKIAGAEAGELYDLKMECAAIIRKAANDLIVHQHSLEMFGFADAAYFEIIRDLVDEYRLLFINWVAGFDRWNYVIDRWGLFNPPGVGPFDKDPDEGIPFGDPFEEEEE